MYIIYVHIYILCTVYVGLLQNMSFGLGAKPSVCMSNDPTHSKTICSHSDTSRPPDVLQQVTASTASHICLQHHLPIICSVHGMISIIKFLLVNLGQNEASRVTKTLKGLEIHEKKSWNNNSKNDSRIATRGSFPMAPFIPLPTSNTTTGACPSPSPGSSGHGG